MRSMRISFGYPIAMRALNPFSIFTLAGSIIHIWKKVVSNSCQDRKAMNKKSCAQV